MTDDSTDVPGDLPSDVPSDVSLPIDFTPLDPTADRLRHERALRAVRTRAAGALAARRARRSALAEVARWRRGMVAAAAIIAALSAVTHARVGLPAPEAAPEAARDDGGVRAQFAYAIGVPAPLARTIGRGASPAVSELLYGGDR